MRWTPNRILLICGSINGFINAIVSKVENRPLTVLQLCVNAFVWWCAIYICVFSVKKGVKWWD